MYTTQFLTEIDLALGLQFTHQAIGNILGKIRG